MREEVMEAAGSLREAMTVTLGKHARKKRWCSWSKPWWYGDLKELRKDRRWTRRKWRCYTLKYHRSVRTLRQVRIEDG